MDVATALLVAATVTNGVATGATFDQAFKQLPARHRIGAPAYATYARAADLGNGLVWYPIMGVTTAVVTVAAIIAGFLDAATRLQIVALVLMAAGTAGFLAATSRAAPALLSLRRDEVSERAGAVLDRFARINEVRAVALAITLAATVWALILASAS
jgi:hypothetical protein